MNDFTKNMAQALFNQDKINDLLRKELQQAVNDFDAFKSIPSSFTLSDGEHIYKIKPRDVLEITEE